MTRFTTPVTIRTCGLSARLEAGASLVTSRCCSMPSTWLHQIRSTFFFSHREFLAYQDIWEKRPPRVGRGILGCHTCRRICLLSFLLERTNENNGHASASSAPNKLLINEERHLVLISHSRIAAGNCSWSQLEQPGGFCFGVVSLITGTRT
jgi:hypothetical protein